MLDKSLPFTSEEIKDLASKYPTPLHLYDEAGMRANLKRLHKAFSWLSEYSEFREYFAVKATPNPYILDLLKEEGLGGDCSSKAELLLCESVGIKGEEIMFTSNNTPAEDFLKAIELGAVVNLDDITHINYLEELSGLPELLCFRYNPGPLREGNEIIGKPEKAKYGFTKTQLLEGYKLAREKGVKRFGLHTMVASNELNVDYFLETVAMLFDVVNEIHEQLGITFEFINIGGGIGIPYKPEDQPLDLEVLGQGIKRLYEKNLEKHPAMKIYMECGRMITGPYGYLVTTAVHRKEIYNSYIGVDACMADLMRPGMYGAYHHITVAGKEGAANNRVYDVVGSLCENNDKFAIDRRLPEIEIGDIIVIHDTGAHGHSMGFNYNGKLRSAEVLFKEDKSSQLIRRAETYSDYFATIDYPSLIRE